MSKTAVSHGIAAVIGASLFAAISGLLMPSQNNGEPINAPIEEPQGLLEQKDNTISAAELNQMSSDNSSLLVSKNKEIALLKNRINEQKLQLAQFRQSQEPEVDSKTAKGTFKATPDRADLSQNINESLVVALYSK